MSHRTERVSSLIRHEISDLLQRQIKDPRLGDFVAVTEVVVSADLKYARVFVSRIATEEEKRQTLSALNAASGFLRRELTRRLKLRQAPELIFEWDNSIERGDRLLRLMDQISSDSSDTPDKDTPERKAAS